MSVQDKTDVMPIQRAIADIQTPETKPGFLGNGHTARMVVGEDFSQSDPFIILMDDMLDKKDTEPAGGPHPHAGFETVTLLLEGELGEMKQGDMQMMTAGSGIVHTETIDTINKFRILQLWLNLPKKDRWTTPRLQDISVDKAPIATGDGWKARVYSGSFAGVSSPVNNYVPVIIADIQLQPGAKMKQELPAAFNTFLYVIDGDIEVGADKTALHEAQIGWLDRYIEDASSELSITTGAEGARLVLYAGLPTGDHIVSYGPFIGDTQEDIVRLYRDYREHKMGHINDVPAAQKLEWR